MTGADLKREVRVSFTFWDCPRGIAVTSFKRQERNDAVTEIEEIPDRGHALTIDSGWRER